MKALVIDDSSVIRRMICRIMDTLEYTTEEACNGVEALKILSEMESVDVVLVDWNMPEMNGLDFIKSVRAGDIHTDVPIIMVTTESEMSRMALAFMAGVNEYIMKPFTSETIQSKLDILGIGVTA